MNFFVRLKKLRKHLGFSQDKISKELEIPQTTYSNWERGRNEPPLEILSTFCNKHNVNLNWLLSGQGEMFQTINPPQEVIDSKILQELQEIKKQIQPQPPYPGTYLLKPPERKIPLISGVNCGQTIVLAGDSVELIGCPAIAGKADFVFTARGNSMVEYRIFDGDYIYVKKQDEYYPGNTIVIHVIENGESYLVCKKYTDKKKFVDGKGNEFQCVTDKMCNCKVIGIVTAILGKPL